LASPLPLDLPGPHIVAPFPFCPPPPFLRTSREFAEQALLFHGRLSSRLPECVLSDPFSKTLKFVKLPPWLLRPRLPPNPPLCQAFPSQLPSINASTRSCKREHFKALSPRPGRSYCRLSFFFLRSSCPGFRSKAEPTTVPFGFLVFFLEPYGSQRFPASSPGDSRVFFGLSP